VHVVFHPGLEDCDGALWCCRRFSPRKVWALIGKTATTCSHFNIEEVQRLVKLMPSLLLRGPLLPLRFSPVPGIFLRNDPIRNEPPVLPCIKSLESGKTTAEMQRESGLIHFITLASNENPSWASPCTLACPAGTCVSSVSVVSPFRCSRKQY